MQAFETRSQSFVVNTAIPREGDSSGGKLIAIGGRAEKESLECMTQEISRDELIIIVPIASDYQDEEYDRYKLKFQDLDRSNTYYLTHKEITESKDRLIPPEARGIFFTGGKQDRIMERTKYTSFPYELREFYGKGGIIAGSSAGASVLSEIMPIGDDYAQGLGFTSSIVDQHFTLERRLPRLQRLVKLFPERIGIGVAENTAAILHNNRLHVMGEGSVYLVNSSECGDKIAFDPVALYEGDVVDLSSYCNLREQVA